MSDGGAEISARGVCWSLNINPTTSDSKTSDGSGEGQFTSNLTELAAGSVYHVRAYATNSVGTAYGADLSFTTSGDAPECITQAATNITISGATLNGTVNASDLTTTVTFEYGITSSYGNSVTANQSPVSGNNMTNVDANISGLTPGTKYHYRVASVNSLGTTFGNDQTFNTEQSIPDLTTLPASNKTSNSVMTGGNITSDGGAEIISKGICYSTTPFPTIINNITINGSGTESFTTKITCLFDQTTYYVRAYATNSIGTAYGDQVSFTTEISPITFNPDLTYGTVSDIDGNCYKTIQIGDELWMAENLKTSRYNDGSIIPEVTDNTEWSNLCYPVQNESNEWINGGTGAFCWYNNSETFENEYGKLYNWMAVNTGTLCPVGWRIPDSGDWLRLIIDWAEYNPNEFKFGYYLMETGTDHWDELINVFPEGIIANNSTGFTALPGGYRQVDGLFRNLGSISYFWGSDYVLYDLVSRFYIPSSAPTHTSYYSAQAGSGYSVRCIKD